MKTESLGSRPLCIVGKADCDIGGLHHALDCPPVHACVKQNFRKSGSRRPDSDPRFVLENGGYTILYSHRTDMAAMMALIQRFGFEIEQPPVPTAVYQREVVIV